VVDNPHPLILKNESQPSIEVKDQPLHRLRVDNGSTLAGFCYFLTCMAGWGVGFNLL